MLIPDQSHIETRLAAYPMIEKEVKSIGSLIEAIKKDHNSDKGSIWFRGQSDATWSLLPGFMRSSSSISETTLLNRFRQSAALLAGHLPRTTFDWTFLMQHYGVPTRLLDWTESPLVALYFAVSDLEERPDANAALWALWPTALNMNANIDDKVEDKYIPSFDDEELQNYSTESVRQNLRLQLFPVATIATRNNARIQAQMGTFTVHHSKKIAIEEVGDKSHIAKYTIPKDARRHILEELHILGINRFSLFPELASVGSLLKDMMK